MADSVENTAQIVHVGGDGSHLAIVDAEQYRSFVGDWAQDDRLRKHLINQSARESVIAWGTGFECDWKLAISPGISNRSGFREFESVITTKSGKLYVVNFDSLTMAAQFENHTLPDEETADYRFVVPPGRYRVRIVQLVDPESKWWESLGDGPAFLIEFEPSAAGGTPAKEIPWSKF